MSNGSVTDLKHAKNSEVPESLVQFVRYLYDSGQVVEVMAVTSSLPYVNTPDQEWGLDAGTWVLARLLDVKIEDGMISFVKRS